MELFASVGHFSTRNATSLFQVEFPDSRYGSRFCLDWQKLTVVMPITQHQQEHYATAVALTLRPRLLHLLILRLLVSTMAFLFMLQSLPHTRIRTWTRDSRPLHSIPLAPPHAFLHSTQTIEHLFKQPRLHRLRRRRHHHHSKSQINDPQRCPCIASKANLCSLEWTF